MFRCNPNPNLSLNFQPPEGDVFAISGMERYVNINTTDDDEDVCIDEIEPSQDDVENIQLYEPRESEIEPYSDLINDENFLNEIANNLMTGGSTSKHPSARKDDVENEVEMEDKEASEKEDEVAADLYRLLKVRIETYIIYIYNFYLSNLL